MHFRVRENLPEAPSHFRGREKIEATPALENPFVHMPEQGKIPAPVDGPSQSAGFGTDNRGMIPAVSAASAAAQVWLSVVFSASWR